MTLLGAFDFAMRKCKVEPKLARQVRATALKFVPDCERRELLSAKVTAQKLKAMAATVELLQHQYSSLASKFEAHNKRNTRCQHQPDANTCQKAIRQLDSLHAQTAAGGGHGSGADGMGHQRPHTGPGEGPCQRLGDH